MFIVVVAYRRTRTDPNTHLRRHVLQGLSFVVCVRPLVFSPLDVPPSELYDR